MATWCFKCQSCQHSWNVNGSSVKMSCNKPTCEYKPYQYTYSNQATVEKKSQ